MPRQSGKTRTEVKQEEEDYLEVDKPVPGQNFVCLSFVSPDKVLKQKEDFFAYHYHNYRMKYYHDMLKSQIEKLLENESESVSIEKITELRKTLKGEFEKDLTDFDGYMSCMEDFKYREEEKLQVAFDKENNFQTSVRGLKVRGVYDSKTEADARAAALQRQDQSFDVFVGQVGYWLPWDPCCTKIADQEYLNNDLNKLVKEYKANEKKKDMFYQEQKQQRAKEAISTAERLRHKLAMKQQKKQDETGVTPVEDETTPEFSTSAKTMSLDQIAASAATPEVNVNNNLINLSADSLTESAGEVANAMGITMMQEEDPWLQYQQRKKEEQSTANSS